MSGSIETGAWRLDSRVRMFVTERCDANLTRRVCTFWKGHNLSLSMFGPGPPSPGTQSDESTNGKETPDRWKAQDSFLWTRLIPVVGLVIGLSGLTYGCYGTEDREISFKEAVKGSQVFDPALAGGGIVISDTSGTAIQGGVYLNELAVWNSGDTVIETGEFMSVPTVRLPEGVRVLSYGVSKSDNMEAGRYQLVQQSGNTFSLTWDRMFPGSYVALTFLYESDDAGSVSLDNLEGVVSANDTDRFRYVEGEIDRLSILALIIVILSFFISFLTKMALKKVWRGRETMIVRTEEGESIDIEIIEGIKRFDLLNQKEQEIYNRGTSDRFVPIKHKI